MPVAALRRPRVRPDTVPADTNRVARAIPRFRKRQAGTPPRPPPPGDESDSDSDGIESGDESDDSDDEDELPATRPPPTNPSQQPPSATVISGRPTVTVITVASPVSGSSSSSASVTASPTPTVSDSASSSSNSDVNFPGGANTSTGDSSANSGVTPTLPETSAASNTAANDTDVAPQGSLVTPSSSVSAGAIAGIVIGLLFLLGLVAFFVIRRRFIKKRLEKRNLWTPRPFIGAFSSSVTTRDSTTPSNTTRGGGGPAMMESGYGGVATLPNLYTTSYQTTNSGQSSLAPSRRNSQPTITSPSQSSMSFASNPGSNGNTAYSNNPNPYVSRFSGTTTTSGYTFSSTSSGISIKTVKHVYIPERPDEMAVQVGSQLRVLAEYDDGWGLCQDMVTRQQGMVPLACFGGPYVVQNETATVSSGTLDRDVGMGRGGYGSGDDELRPPTAFREGFRLSKRASSLAPGAVGTPTRA